MPPQPPPGPPQPPHGQPQPPPGPPQYKVYRSRRSLRDRLRPDREPRELREKRERPPSIHGARKPLWRRALRYALIGAVVWLLFSFVVFMVSAQTQDGVSQRAENALSDGGAS